MRRVLAAIDAGPGARAVLDTAGAIGELFDATVVALHVPEDDSTAARQAADEAGVELRELAGAPIDTIATAAQTPDIAAVVLGARRTQRGPRPAGHAALALITRVQKPIIVVPPGHTGRRLIARLLTPLEGTTASSEAIAGTIELADRRDLEIIVLHVHGPHTVPAFQDQPHHAIAAWTREFAARFVSIPRAPITIVERVGAAADCVLAEAGDRDADLIVLGWNQDLSPGRAHVVREVLASSTIPVLLVPAG